MSNRKRSVEIEFLAEVRKLKTGLNQVEREVASTGQKISNDLNKRLGAGLALAGGAAAIAGVKQLIDGAAQLGDAYNAVGVIFGSASKKVEQFAETAAKSAGLSTRETLQMLGPIGSMLRNVGLSEEEAADKAIMLTQRAADMASQLGGPVTDALTAVSAALRGEGDPIEKYGASVNAVAVQTKALEMNLAATAAEITNSDKVLARMAIIMEETDRTSGDFANTADDMANRMRTFGAEITNVKDRLGTALMPAAEGTLGVFEDLVPVLEDAATEIAELVAEIKPLLDVAGEAIKIYTDLKGNVDDMTESDNRLVAGIGEIIDVLTSGGIRTIGTLADMFDTTADSAGHVTQAMREDLTSALATATGSLDTTAAAADNTARALRNTASAQKELLSPTFAAIAAAKRHEDAQSKLVDAEEALKDARREHGRNSDEAVAAEEAVEEANLGVATSYVDMKVSAENLGNTIDRTVVAALERTLTAAGLAEGAIRSLLGLTVSLAGVPLAPIRDPNRARQGPAIDTQGGFIERSGAPVGSSRGFTTYVTNVYVAPPTTPVQARQMAGDVARQQDQVRRERSSDMN